MDALSVLKTVNFDWTLLLKSVWNDDIPHVNDLHKNVRDDILEKLDELSASDNVNSPLGKVIQGYPGSGKTHLLGSIRGEVFARKQWFVLVDMTDVREFEETLLLGFLDSLQVSYPNGRLQYEAVLDRFLKKLSVNSPSLDRLSKLPEERLVEVTSEIINRLRRRYRADMFKHQDTLRALIYFHSKSNTLQDIGYSYLFCYNTDDDNYSTYQFIHSPRSYIDIVKSLSWIMSIGGATLLALDQLDAIVTQQHLASGSEDEISLNDEQKKALSIINGIGRGLSALRDQTSRTLIVLSCLYPTWEILTKKALESSTDRFEDHLRLRDVNDSKIAASIVSLRMRRAFQKMNFQPPYPTWPYKIEAFERQTGITPREILKRCEKYRREWIQKREIWEIDAFDDTKTRVQPVVPIEENHELDSDFEKFKKEFMDFDFFDEESEDERLGRLLQDAYRYLLRETLECDSIDAVVDCDFPSSKQYPPLHARIRLVYRDESDREEHYCVRALIRTHPRSYSARLKAAMAAAGIDRDLSFRRLRLIRDKETPSGAVTQQLTNDFIKHDGAIISPSKNDLIAIAALRKVEEKSPSDFLEWLSARKPVSSLSMMADTMQWLGEKVPADGFNKRTIDEGVENTTIEEPATPPTKMPVDSKPSKVSPDKPKTAQRIFIGNRLVAAQIHEEIHLDLISLTKHTVILAGSGSGKTVLIKRMIEESVLAGIPSIVIDAANDLARLGNPWPDASREYNEVDFSKAKDYFSSTEAVIWTPGREMGNPLHLSPLPDFSAVRNDIDELNQAVSLAHDAFSHIVAPGASVKASKKSGILSGALRYFAKNSCGDLSDFIELLSDLPPDAGCGISDSEKIAREIADQIRAVKETNPLLKSKGSSLDPSLLLSSDSDKTRISVINFIGLPGLETQQAFLNQLAMTLFTWIKKNPASPEKPLRGLLVIDEAKDFIPSGRSTPCKESLIRLAAQARKYGLGLIFATQAPKSIDHNVIANCANHFYGQANSPTAIATIEEQIKQRGGSGQDVSKLGAGNFYVFSERINGETPKAPVKIKTPLCLSHHPNSPMDEESVLIRAQQCKKI